MSTRQYFSVSEANDMIPYLEDTMHRLVQFSAQIRESYEKLETMGFAPEDDQFELEVEGADKHVISERATLKALISAVREDMQALNEKGVVVKDLDQGLVDWYTRHQGRDVFLCWKRGEKSVRHWHELDAGFAGRRSIDELAGDA